MTISNIENNDKFNWSKKVERPVWIINDILAKGSLTFIMSQSGTGKSWMIQELINSLLWQHKFMNKFDVNYPCNILLIDQDTPTNSLESNLILFGNHNDTERKGELIVKSHQGYIIGKSIINAMAGIFERNKIDIVIIDTLSSICGSVSMVEQSEMSRIEDFQVSFPGVTFVITHHITEKRDLSVDEMMTCNAHQLGMYSSVINQKADMMFYLANPDHGKSCDRVFVRPYSKRYMSNAKNFVWTLHQEPNREKPEMEWVEYKGDYIAATGDFSKEQSFVLNCIDDGNCTTNSIYTALQGALSIDTVRKVLAQLVERDEIKFERIINPHKNGNWSYLYSRIIKECDLKHLA
jgi:hypothetical protein